MVRRGHTMVGHGVIEGKQRWKLTVVSGVRWHH